jgi:hypothetical protein
MSKPKVLVVDIETSPIISYTWGLWDQNVALNQIQTDWNVLSVAAKWLGDPASKVMYKDQRNAKDVHDDTDLLKWIWKLLDEADIVLTQNGNQFDTKKLNARFVLSGMQPPSSYKKIDTLVLAKKYFAFTSNKLEYMSNKLCTKYKKLKTKQFQGFDLWKECLAGNKKAWQEMEQYNKHDVLALEELYTKLQAWDTSLNFDLYDDGEVTTCKCGGKHFQRRGFYYTASGKFQKYRCMACGAETRSKQNLFSKEKKKSLRVSTSR